MQKMIVFLFVYLSGASLFSIQSVGKIGSKTLFYFDKSREHPLIAEFYYPTAIGLSGEPTSNNFRELKEFKNASFPHWKKKLPLVIFSHGYMGGRKDLFWLQELLAANGYLVISVDHFGNTFYMQRAENSLKRWDRAKDISFILNELSQDSLLKKVIDFEKVGFVGFSLGGLTGIWLAGGIAKNYPIPDIKASNFLELDDGITQEIIDKINFSKAKKCFRDQRIKAEVLFSPVYGSAFTKESLSRIKIPLLIITGEKDQIASIKENSLFFAENVLSAGLHILKGEVGHFVFLSTKRELGNKALLPMQYMMDHPSICREEIHGEVGEMVLKFFKKSL